MIEVLTELLKENSVFGCGLNPLCSLQITLWQMKFGPAPIQRLIKELKSIDLSSASAVAKSHISRTIHYPF